MNEARANRILAALKEQGVDQMLITDPMSICYLTGISMAPIERFYALLLKADGHHYYFLNNLFNVPGDVGVEKVWYSDTDASDLSGSGSRWLFLPAISCLWSKCR